MLVTFWLRNSWAKLSLFFAQTLHSYLLDQRLNFLQVFPFGSVPLKTYLPDGDIDLTAFGGANKEDKLANDMKSLLEEEEKNTAAEFVVKDVQLIRAEVCFFLIGEDALSDINITMLDRSIMPRY